MKSRRVHTRKRLDYRIREVDGFDDDIAEELVSLHRLTFGSSAPNINPEIGHWWLAYYGVVAVAFAGLQKSTVYNDAGYFVRVGVLQKHRGNRLQNRLMRALETRARRNGWKSIVSDTTDNPPSANCFVRRGWHTFSPKIPWSFPSSIYWRKNL